MGKITKFNFLNFNLIFRKKIADLSCLFKKKYCCYNLPSVELFWKHLFMLLKCGSRSVFLSLFLWQRSWQSKYLTWYMILNWNVFQVFQVISCYGVAQIVFITLKKVLRNTDLDIIRKFKYEYFLVSKFEMKILQATTQKGCDFLR